MTVQWFHKKVLEFVEDNFDVEVTVASAGAISASQLKSQYMTR